MAYQDPRVDQVVARELVLYIENDSQLYRQQGYPIVLALAKRKVNKTYDPQLAVKAYENLVETGMKKYSKEFGKIIANPATRNHAAKELLENYQEAINGAAKEMTGLKKDGKPWTLRR